MNILIATNSEYLPYTKIMLTSLFCQHNFDDIDIYLMYEDLDENEVSELSSFVEKHPQKRFFAIRVGSELKNKVESHNGISIDTYYRILAIDLLPETVSKILYLDVDMIIKKPITDLYNIDITGTPFAVCDDILGILNDFNEANKYRMNIPKEYIYFNAGVMLMNIDYLRKTGACQKIMSNVYANYERYEYNDQDVLNAMYYDNLVIAPWEKYNCPPALYIKSKKDDTLISYAEFKTVSRNPKFFSENYINVTRKVGDNATIIHYMGNTKPWSKTRQDSDIYSIFDEYYFEAKVNFREVLKKYIIKYYPYEYMCLMLDAAYMESTDTVIMGSSYGLHALDIRQFKTETNISSTSQDLEHDYLLLKHILENKTSGEIRNLVLVLGKYAIYDRKNKSEMGRHIIENVYNPILHKSDIWFGFEELSEKQKNKIRISSRNIILKGGNFFNDKYMREDNCKEQYKGVNWSEVPEREKERLSRIRTDQHNKLLSNRDVGVSMEENITYLDKILKLADNHKIKTIVVIPPFTKYYNRFLNEAFLNKMLGVLNEVPYEINFYDLNEYVVANEEDIVQEENMIFFSDEDFFDMDHLNDRGAQKFTRVLLDYIL